MRYGHFDDDNREYVIETPFTPLPWINYLGCEEFFSLISQTGNGYSFFRDPKLRRLTRYRYNNVPADVGGRMYYVRDGDSLWSPAFAPRRELLDSFKCRHGLGYTIFEAYRADLGAELTCFVPLGSPCEINRLILHNRSGLVKAVEVVSAVEWCLWNAQDDAQNFQRNYNTAEVEVDGFTLYHKTEYRERRNHYAFFHVNHPIAGYDTARDAFIGRGDWQRPDALAVDESGGSIAQGWAPIASHRIRIELMPDEKQSLIFLLGYCELPKEEKWERAGVINKEPARAMIGKFETDAQVDAALRELAEYWGKRLEGYHVESGDDKLDRMVNIWNPYQCMITFNLSRSASFFESGLGRGMGFRDSCQDLLGFVHMLPERARERILDLAAIQLPDGSCYHQYQPLNKKGNADIGGDFNDDPLWLVACVGAYIRETGDGGILAEPVAFDTKPGTEQPLFEHLRRSVMFTVEHRGPHGLPLIGRADWNDCLNLNCYSEDPNDSFQTVTNTKGKVAESVFIAAMFTLYGERFAELCDRFPQYAPFDAEKTAGLIRGTIDAVKGAVLKHGWDGAWFLRAYDAQGGKVGSKECAEGRIFIEPQGFCVMAGIGREGGEARMALDSVQKYLSTDYGVCLLHPAYTAYDLRLGEISSYPPGLKENGSVFCHNNPWVSIAEALMGNAEEAFRIYCKICPAYIEDISDIHRTEPYVYCQTIAGKESPSQGEAKNSWLTGSAAWSFVNVSQFILGLQPDYEGLRINPCLPPHIGELKLTRLFRGTAYHIHILRGGEKGVWADGLRQSGSLVSHIPGRESREVRVVL